MVDRILRSKPAGIFLLRCKNDEYYLSYKRVDSSKIVHSKIHIDEHLHYSVEELPGQRCHSFPSPSHHVGGMCAGTLPCGGWWTP